MSKGFVTLNNFFFRSFEKFSQKFSHFLTILRGDKLLRGGYRKSNVSSASCLTVLLWQKLCDRLFGGSDNEQCFSQLISQLYTLTKVLKLPDKFLEVCYTDQCFWQLDSLSMTAQQNFHDTNQRRKKLGADVSLRIVWKICSGEVTPSVVEKRAGVC